MKMYELRHAWSRFAALVCAFALLFALAVPAYVGRYELSLRATAGIYACFVMLLALVLAPGVPGSRDAIRTSSEVYSPYGFLVLWLVPYLAYAAGTADFRWSSLLRLLVIGAAVLLVYQIFPVRDRPRFAWQDAVVGSWLIAIVLTHQPAGIWRIPVNLDFMGRLFLIAVGAWCWTFIRIVPALGYEFTIRTPILVAALKNFLYFAAIAIPVSLALHFTRWNPRWPGLAVFCLNYLEIFLFVALLEELFFRGFLQNLFSNSLGSWKLAQLLASVLFGLFHILHAPFPNWRYVALATVAGWFYGSAYRQSGNLMASALLHALVDTVWRTWLTR